MLATAVNNRNSRSYYMLVGGRMDKLYGMKKIESAQGAYVIIVKITTKFLRNW